jgi:hypothetical protein
MDLKNFDFLPVNPIVQKGIQGTAKSSHPEKFSTKKKYFFSKNATFCALIGHRRQ